MLFSPTTGSGGKAGVPISALASRAGIVSRMMSTVKGSKRSAQTWLVRYSSQKLVASCLLRWAEIEVIAKLGIAQRVACKLWQPVFSPVFA
jgi:hypothetical protein